MPTTHRPAPMIPLRAGLGALLALAMLVALPAVAAAQTPLGTAVGVRQLAEGELGGTRVTLIAGNQLFQGQTIVTDATGEVQIVFADETRMVVGPNSSMVIETYLLQNANTIGNLTVNALGGTFRFISGNSPSSAYHINVPTGAISVRGTELDFTIDPDSGAVYVIVYEGAVYLCTTAGVCVTLGSRCEVGVIGPALTERVLDTRPRFTITRTQFMYARSQWRLLTDFQVTYPLDCLFAEEDETTARDDEPPPGSSESEGSESEWGSEGPNWQPPNICDYLFNSPFGGKSGIALPPWIYEVCYGPGK